MARRSIERQLAGAVGGDDVTVAMFSSPGYTTESLINRAVAPAASLHSGAPLGRDNAAALLQSLQKLDEQLGQLQLEVSSRSAALRDDVSADAAAYTARISQAEAELAALHGALGELERRGGGAARLASRVGSRLQAADSLRRRALSAAQALEHLREFSVAEDPSSLPELFHDEERMAEAAGVAGQLWDLVSRVMESRERAAAAAGSRRGSVDANPGAGGGGTPRGGAPAPGSLEAAAEQLELYRNVLDNRVVSRFDAALESQDLPGMAACARVMAAGGGRGTALLVSRYISTRPMFADPRKMHSLDSNNAGRAGDGATSSTGSTPAKPVADGADGDAASAAAASMRSLSDLYRSLAASLRDEAVVMEQVFPDPGAAVAALVQRVFEQPVAAALESALHAPPADAPPDALRSHLRLLTEAHRRTRALSDEAADLAGEAAPAPADLTAAACGAALDAYLPMEVRWAAALGGAKVAAARRSLNKELLLDLMSANEEAVRRCTSVLPPGLPAAAAVRLLFHADSSGGGGGSARRSAGAAPTACLLGQAAAHILLGLAAASDACAKRLAGPFRAGADVGAEAAALADLDASLGELLRAASSAAAMAALLRRHHDRVIAPHVAPAPAEAAACAEGLRELVAAVEERCSAALQRAVTALSRRLDLTLSAEQRRADFRPLPEDGAPLDRPTYACVVATALLAAAGELARRHLHGANQAALAEEIGRRAAAAVQAHMLRYTFSPEGALRWRRDVAEYAGCVAHRLGARSAAAAFEELGAQAAALIVAPEAVGGLVEGTLRLSPAQAQALIERREDYKTARVGGRPLAALFAAAG